MAKRTSKPNRKQNQITGVYVRPVDGRSFRIDETTKFDRFLSSVKSFSFSRYANPVGDQWLITCRREKRQSGFFWYAFKTVEGKTYKVYIGQNVTLEALKDAVKAMMEKIEKAKDETE